MDDCSQMGAAKTSPSRREFFWKKHWRKHAVITFVEIILISLILWTAYSPTPLAVQNNADLSNSLFQFAKTTEIVNSSDGSGIYSFLFGMDHNSSYNPGSHTIIEVYASLVAGEIHSGFTKGIALQFDEVQVLIDGTQDTGVKDRVSNQQNIVINYLSPVQFSQPPGMHNLTVRLIVSIVDVNYIGYASGNQFLVTLNG
ncbi:MAG: hypothetical protein ACHQ1H_14410, partial [Nitrososphaerales archaeon]